MRPGWLFVRDQCCGGFVHTKLNGQSTFPLPSPPLRQYCTMYGDSGLLRAMSSCISFDATDGTEQRPLGAAGELCRTTWGCCHGYLCARAGRCSSLGEGGSLDLQLPTVLGGLQVKQNVPLCRKLSVEKQGSFQDMSGCLAGVLAKAHIGSLQAAKISCLQSSGRAAIDEMLCASSDHAISSAAGEEVEVVSQCRTCGRMWLSLHEIYNHCRSSTSMIYWQHGHFHC